MPTKQTNWTTVIMVALALLGFLGGLTVPTLRWAFNVETRLHDLEKYHDLEHSNYKLTKE